MTFPLYLTRDGKKTGPFPQDQVIAMLNGGFVVPDDLCWHEGLTDWVPLSQVLGLATEGPPPVRGTTAAHSDRHPGFWLRLAAHLIDTLICYVGGFVVGFVIGLLLALTGGNDAHDLATVLGAIAGGVFGWLYYALMESSAKQATLGKMACGFIVTDLQGNRISFGRATGRVAGMIISTLTLFVGYLMCAWTERKQCLHDKMADCLMFKK